MAPGAPLQPTLKKPQLIQTQQLCKLRPLPRHIDEEGKAAPFELDQGVWDRALKAEYQDA